MTPSDGYGQRQVMAILSGLLLASFRRLPRPDRIMAAAAMYRIGESLDGLTAQAWVTTAFLISSTISVPVFGKLSDTHGRKRLFVVCDRRVPGRVGAVRIRRLDGGCWRPSAPSRASRPAAS